MCFAQNARYCNESLKYLLLVLFICILFVCTGEMVFLSAAQTVHAVAVQDHRMTDQVRGQRKSSVLFKPCKSGGLAPHFLSTHTFFHHFFF